MDILKFINSKDIRNHLEKIGYEFNSLEAAWLIYQCRSATVKEKHKAWNELIKTMPDCRIEERWFTPGQESLHEFLKKYMELEDGFINDFYDEKHTDTFDDEKPYIYSFEYINDDCSHYMCDGIFSRFDAIYETALEPDDAVVKIRCIRTQLDCPDIWQRAELTPSFEFLSIDPGRIENDTDKEIFWLVFEGLWFDFPVPFSEGDVLWNPNQPHSFCGGPFVFRAKSLDTREDKETANLHRLYGDTTDMCVCGSFLNEDGSIYNEVTCNYMDLEYYDTSLLTGAASTLAALSNYYKHGCNPVKFANSYHKILTNGYVNTKIYAED